MRPTPEPTAPGQESVWDYPRPPRIERTSKELAVHFGDTEIARTTAGQRVLETSHPPTYYLPLADVRSGVLRKAEGQTLCEFKGQATYYDVVVGDRVAPRAAWGYRDGPLADHVAFYAGPMDRCTVDGVVVTPQEGGFYGGWITPDLAGPFKGGPGTRFW